MGFKQNVQEITTKIQKQTNSKDILIFQIQDIINIHGSPNKSGWQDRTVHWVFPPERQTCFL